MILETILGSLTGIAGSIANNILNYKLKQLELQGKKLDHEHEINLLKLQAETKQQIIQTEQDGIIYQKSQESISKYMVLPHLYQIIKILLTYQHKILKYPAFLLGYILLVICVMIELLRMLIRPSITIYQAGITTWLVYKSFLILNKTTGNVITPDIAKTIITNIFNTVIFLTVSIFTWWFGDRQTQRFLYEHLNFIKR